MTVQPRLSQASITVILPLQRAQGLFAGLAFGQLVVVAGAAGAVPVVDLCDRGQVDGVVEPPVPAPGQPVDLPLAGRHLDRGGAVRRRSDRGLGKRDTWRTSPMTAAAMTGPTPNSPVRLVPAAATAVASLFLVSRIWVSMWRRSSVNSAASSRRAASTAPDGVIDAKSCVAWPAVICLKTPPGISSHSTACSRQATWVRARPRSRWRLDQTFSTAA
jgi:hypothetical protein